MKLYIIIIKYKELNPVETFKLLKIAIGKKLKKNSSESKYSNVKI